MQRFYNTAETLAEVLRDVDPLDSDQGEIDIEPDSDSSELSSVDEDAPMRVRAGPEAYSPVGPAPARRSESSKDGTVWHEEQIGAPPHFTPITPYARDGEPTAKAWRNVCTRLDVFLTFITLDMLRSIQEWTIQHAQMEHADWFMTIPELMAFLSIVIFRGITKLPSLPDCWLKALGVSHIMDTMPRERFKQIMRHLRFDDRSTRAQRGHTDKFAAISDVWESFVKNCISSYNPGRHITIDEQLFPSKVKCNFLQYMASKPDKFGVKFWVAADLKSKYICNAMPYLGRDPGRPSNERLSENVVMRLMEPFLDKGRTVTTDNFFTSLELARRLSVRETTLLGTMNKIRREIPPSMREMNHKEFTTQVFSTTGVTLTVYAARRNTNVYILSSMHGAVRTAKTPKAKPDTVTMYNSTKCGVDVVDQMLRKYTVRRATHRWPIAIFYNMVDMAALNAYVLFQACTGTQERRVDFLVALAQELAASHVAEKKARIEQAQKQQRMERLIRQPSTPGKHAICQVRLGCKSNHATVRCFDCYRYTCGKCKIDVPWRCKKCQKDV